ncbi:VWA domain-containing protein [bacterium]|nr:VWA domain-containing protein [bacterium]
MKLRIFFTVLICSMLLPTFALAEAILMANHAEFPENLMPISSIQTTIEIQDQVALTTIDQTFLNPFLDAVDATYYYPVPEEAMVTGFGIWQGDSLVYFELNPGEQGAPGGPGEDNSDLQSYLGKNPFAAPLEDLNSEEIRVRFEYSMLMEYSFGQIEYSYPLAMGDFITQPIHQIEINATLRSQRSIEQFSVRPYPFDFEYDTPDSIGLTLELEEIENLDDIHFSLSLDQEDTGLWLMTQHDDPDSAGHFLAILEPGRIEPDDIFQKYFTFVMDVSGSMGGENRINEAKEAAIYCISNLDEADFFNIITFNSQVNRWQNEMVAATTENINDAVEFINSRNPYGGTNIDAALYTALIQEMGENSANQILLLSDGEPTSGETRIDRILGNVRDANTNLASIFTVGVGAAGNGGQNRLHFLSMIAYQNQGLSIYIPPNTPDVAEQIGLFFTRFSNPAMIDIHLGYGDIGAYDIYPPEPYTIFAGTQTIIGGRNSRFSETDIEVNGRVVGDDVTLNYGPFEFAEDADQFAFVPKLWAMSKIDYWLAWMAVYGEDQDIVDMIIELSLQYGILTPYTEYETDPGDENPVEEENLLHLLVSHQKNGVLLHWEGMLTSKIESVKVYRRELGGISWIPLHDESLQTTEFLDSNINPGITYEYRLIATLENGDTFEIIEQITIPSVAPVVSLEVYPNPFNSEANISFNLPAKSTVSLKLYNLMGQELRHLEQGKFDAGLHSVNLNGNLLASGTYYVILGVTPEGNNKAEQFFHRLSLLK